MIGRITGQYNLEALKGKKTRQNVRYESGFSSESDNAKFSRFGTLLSRANAELKNVPEVREELVSEIKAKIEAGTYKEPLGKLADRLILAGMLDVE